MRLAFILLCCIYSLVASAQVYENYDEDDYYNSDFNREQELALAEDSIIIVDNSDDRSGFKKIFSGKPGKAASLSLMIPGWGQVYNGKIWKVPLVYGLEGAAVYYLLQNRSRYRTLDTCYRSLIEDPSPSDQCGRIVNVSDAFVLRQAYRKRRELSYVFVVGAHLFQAFEAYIDRHLVDFDIDEDLSFTPFVQPDYSRLDVAIVGIYYNLSPTKKAAIPKVKF